MSDSLRQAAFQYLVAQGIRLLPFVRKEDGAMVWERHPSSHHQLVHAAFLLAATEPATPPQESKRFQDSRNFGEMTFP